MSGFDPLAPVIVHGLPAELWEVPEEPAAWRAWADRTLLWRIGVRDAIERDAEIRDDIVALCADDPLLDMLLFGAVFEPRDRMRADGLPRPKGWWPFTVYPFQARLVRWIQSVMGTVAGSPEARLGRGDGVLEKARGMAGSWTCCAVAAHGWKYDDGFVAGLMSFKEDLVEKANSTDSLFYKVEGYLGLDPRVPAHRIVRVGADDELVPVRSPDWMVPKGYDPFRHNQDLSLAHPTRTNLITGYSTSGRSAIGARLSVLFLDEGAKYAAFPAVWQSASAVTDHRIGLSSADMQYGPGFRDLARHAEQAVKAGTPGPSFMRLRPEDHPERDEVWREEIEARHAGGVGASEALSREYDLDYEAGQGAHIYPFARTIDPRRLEFRPADQTLDFCIDPGIRDKTAFHLVSYDAGLHRYGVQASYANTDLPAEFYASLVVAQPLLGKYPYGEEEERIMEWFSKHGKQIRYWIGDPAGKARGGGMATSFYDDFARATVMLTDGRRAVRIWSSDKNDYRRIDPRISALRWMLDLTDFNDTPDVRRTLEAVREHRRKASSETREVTSESNLPVRTSGHDRVTALEFYAVHRRLGGAGASAPSNVTAFPARMSMSGKPMKRKTAVAYR